MMKKTIICAITILAAVAIKVKYFTFGVPSYTMEDK